MKRGIIFVLLIVILSSLAYAANEIVQYADKLNYWNAELHKVYVTNNGNQTTQTNFTIPSGFSFNSGSICTVPVAGKIQCVLSSGQTGSYSVDSSTSPSEYDLSTFVPITNNTYTGNNVSFLRIEDDEIFHTLVEYGRGRGNYFFDSMGSGLAGSGHTGSGCYYLPNGTLFELNFLHKILNIKQYFNLADADAENVSFRCIYPDRTVVREHLVSNIVRGSGLWTVDYFISEVGGSWERMGYIGMNFDAGEFNTSQNISVNCTNIKYSLPNAYGNITVNEDSFDLEVRNREPFSVSASTTTGTVGNGTQEVIIAYTITNNEVYDLSNVIIEIEAPQYATFIGTRGELWGVGRDQFRVEKTELQAGQSEVIVLVARFDTSSAGAISTLALSQGVKVQYITCWEANAYNPQEYMQYLGVGTNVSVNMGVPVGVVNIITLLQNINSTVNNVYTTVNIINNTVDNIWNLTWEINQSIGNLPYQVWTYTTRTLTYYPAAGGAAAAGAIAACRWNDTEHYAQTANVTAIDIYNTTYKKTNFTNIDLTADGYRTCSKLKVKNSTTVYLKVCIFNAYSSGDPSTTSVCTLVEQYDPTSIEFSATDYVWKCSDILRKEVTNTTLAIILGCPDCANSSVGWILGADATSSGWSYNSTDSGSSWGLENENDMTEFDWCVPIDYGYEVWTYQNRSLTEYNFTELLDEFNCTLGSSTNKMCELLFAINLTTNNMQATINIINGTVNTIKITTDNIYTDTQNIIDLLNCNGSVDTPICNISLDLNNSIQLLINITNSTYNAVNNINNTLYIMNQSIANQFNYTWTLINNISVSVGNLSISMNCSDPLNNFSTSVCNYVQRIETNTIDINNTVNNVLNIVQYINGTRWGNLTAWDLYQAILNQSID
ncbi:hypothetical protein KY342_01175, partial [Candidatus Woesearchaeota archaeon]|nr:hypothetical protein [Candidatus Woesearchaeota archaeon]